MTKVEAINIFRNIHQTDAEKEALEMLIPELAESEDEGVRKELHNIIRRSINDPNLPYEKRLYISKSVLPYIENLEKQKEQKPVPDKFSGLKSLMLQYLQSAANRKDDAEIESDTYLFGRKILDYIWKQDEKQKEQNPAEWSEEDERNFNWISIGFLRPFKNNI